jgi:hypothetical protein
MSWRVGVHDSQRPREVFWLSRLFDSRDEAEAFADDPENGLYRNLVIEAIEPSTPPPASGPDCAVSPWSSRGCERGTAGCEVKHAAAPAVEPARPTFPGSVAIHPDAVRAPYVASAQATITSAAPPEGGRGEQWKKVCASPLFHFLKREDGRRILELLVAGKISFGKAAQSIVEAYELGVTPLLPPDNPATITLPREEWEAHQDAVALLTWAIEWMRGHGFIGGDTEEGAFLLRLKVDGERALAALERRKP